MFIKYDKIVIGSSLKAVMFAFNKRYPILFTTPHRPFRFDYFQPQTDLSFLKLRTNTKQLNTLNGSFLVGSQKQILWERLLFLLALDSKVPLSNLANSIRFEDNSITCFNEYSKIAKIGFDECYYFGDDNISGLAQEKALADEVFMCYDWVAFNRGGKHDVDYIKTNDQFVQEIWFYPSDRIDGKTAVKDACLVSKLTKEQMSSFDFSETMARFKLIHEMETRGMKGKFNGYGPNGKPKYYKFRTTSIYRESNKRKNQNKPKSTHIKITKSSEKDLLRDLQKSSVAYDRFLKYL